MQVAERTMADQGVNATLNYAGTIEGRPRFDVPHPENINIAFEPVDVIIHDARSHRNDLTIDQVGFAFVKHSSETALDPALFEQNMAGQSTSVGATAVYEEEVAGFLRRWSGASEVITQIGGTTSRTSNRAKRKSWAMPATFVHLDFTPKSANDFLRWTLDQMGREAPPHRRFAIFQTWRAISKGPQDSTLAVCDGSSVPMSDGLVFDSVVGPEEKPGAFFESRICKYGPSHRWYYLSNMEPDDLLVFKGYDSDMPMSMNAMHTAFDNPLAPDDGEPRKSIESRFFAFFD